MKKRKEILRGDESLKAFSTARGQNQRRTNWCPFGS